MEDPLQIAEGVRQACIAVALRAYEEAGLSGLCHEGRWEYAVDAMRAVDLRPLVQTLTSAAQEVPASQGQAPEPSNGDIDDRPR
jgi:hypothetical protein